MPEIRTLLAELRRRKVVRVTAFYLVGTWVLLQVGDTILGLGEFPGWMGQALLTVVVIGLPVAIVLAWMFDLTPEGIVATGEAPAAADQPFSFSEPQPLDPGQLDLVRPQLTPLIGRAEECALLDERLAAAIDGHGGIVLIGGEPGVGKTRLGEEAVTRAHALGMVDHVALTERHWVPA